MNEIPLGTLTLMGSGEMMELMGKVHRRLLSQLTGPIRAVFLDTPAGFQLNADELSARAVGYFQKRFNVPLAVASFKHADLADTPQGQEAIELVRRANYIFAGPGSPSYAARNWLGTPMASALAERFAAGAALVFASAAATVMGKYALPVYEVYKVGADPHWIDGLDVLGPYGYDVAIVPHWNNQEGGTHDTRFCYLGEPRLHQLERQLPDTAVMLGIDEYTACTIDIARNRCEVSGNGAVTVRRRGQEVSFPSGTVFSPAYLKEGPGADAPTPPSEAVPPSGMSVAGEVESQPPALEGDLTSLTVGMIELLIELRSQLRQARQWAMADQVRERLLELGIVLEDGRDGTTWRRDQ